MDAPTRRAIARFWRTYVICLAIAGLVILGCVT